jgi:hypothetical protein
VQWHAVIKTMQIHVLYLLFIIISNYYWVI